MDGRPAPPLLVLAGPTGVGKTAAAAALARRLPVEVVSADSRQVYRGMDLATGKPTPAERRAVAHHLIDVVEPDERYDAARFRADAERAIADIRARGRLPVVVGGTGLYVRALLRGLDPAPPADPGFRRELQATRAREGAAALHARLAAVAPSVAGRLHPNDEVRVIRALERARAGAAPGSLWAAGARRHAAILLGLTRERLALDARLRARAAEMVEAGLLGEVKALLARGFDPGLPAMLGIGYREFALVALGRLDPAEALGRMQRETLRYARRQWTWFRAEPEIEWLDVDACGGPDGVAAAIAQRLDREGAVA
jgi:tRNA dimethylallyltransferase